MKLTIVQTKMERGEGDDGALIDEGNDTDDNDRDNDEYDYV